ncbi:MULTISPECIES: polyribonucleotide nucleotidyltransferase [Exiguobacterium]|uniref:Polyribonucleotide nucleotidyltransferase n=2 Tax=Exiguobacterium chiriqhucha TaxID=1385984 RepID=U1LVA0_9BACL|nr:MULTISPECIES: polyribonucleotide nucleotidyltransferase [Exiguobacterium]ERG66539.1 polyribonucleotide nucleotidyltransferase [Exiguobacterium chiriqhucha RW-2]TCI73941.1 polyribonucleotide nucleotidyltransferase [Exiguobacterium sp. IPCI3]TCI83100.1 polyribonucleotide nucleotidyltransferase [Exiguobacterium sp. IPCH1]TCI84154.1 polyribonucleotide nucleotidyltransferase [Exiguobacterium sp. IPBC4]
MLGTKQVFSTEWGGRPLSVEVGQLAKQANGSALVRYGDTVVLATVTASKAPKDLDFFPLTVNYEEKLYSVGKIPGGFLRREGRPGENAILTSRLIDRPIRPLFPDGFRHDIQVMIYVMSNDPDCPAEMAGMLGTSIALSISDIPFDGPIAGATVGRVNGEFVVNPTTAQLEQTDLELQVAGTATAINMVEAGANEVPEDVMLESILFGHEEIKKLVAFQTEIVEAVGKPKFEYTVSKFDDALTAELEAARPEINAAVQVEEKHARDAAINEVIAKYVAIYEERLVDEPAKLKEVSGILNKFVKDEVRRLITVDKVRPDGRRPEVIRPLASETGLLPRAHGVGLFTRGQTQVMSVATLGVIGDAQIIDGIGLEENKRFMHHYNFPPFSVGEARPVRAPGRREIGHGALGERALLPVIPKEADFPYTIRLVSEVLESNGSSSQASICGSTLALMDAGVPIKAPVAGIAMGLIMEGEHYTVLTDIQGLEDHLGDMDFKVAGTKDGITALQMDIKIAGITREILEEALEQARSGRLHILNHMLETLDAPRPQLSKYAPKIVTMTINPDKIRDVIGPGGKMINSIIDQTGVKIDIEQDGTVFIASTDQDGIDMAMALIGDIVREVVVGEEFDATVRRIEKFGAFVELFKGKDALVHVSEFSLERVANVEDVVKLGDTIKVRVTEIDDKGRVNASHKVLILEGLSPEEREAYEAKRKAQRESRPPRDSRPPRRDGDRRPPRSTN